ncbi:flavodoxin family protein [Bordetella holmesii 30539]|uniref:NADPH--hemoprotein reductase n=2 Tax=Bordetella holmesii TaxID=35814 RepID=A0A158M5W2_9BORD|nr:flavodoxin family protein [Bordetella holmesii ATCC 51541]AIT27532.1 flavodoxin family protein [Bordetella holmesii 44057]EWM41656.1 flavodoxin family protein [Bordetella holmesii 41130]EWM48124.1 flavodoxin family protein [Bordetella holmesii 35009]EWM49105.1 flavodoxin family protein [Bordetella holmesii 70147]EXF87565.1 flavodoxin family protein [Bordetella holmesii 30539]EXX93566.1 flavodoxin family protein [Bordetella holmesii 1058]KAK81403.1 flavodoxin [Bordetella holmesii CDC-H809-
MLVIAWLLLSWRAWRRSRPTPVPLAQAEAWLVAHASQTGLAQELAERSAEALRAAGQVAVVVPLNQVDAPCLARCTRALLVVSTYGEGDAPDGAARFAQQVMRPVMHGSLPQLRYALLALGDSSYARFCGFGRELDQWLAAQKAQRLFDRVEVDRADPAALRHWQRELAAICGAADPQVWQAPDYQTWRLTARQHLNPGSSAGPCYLVSLTCQTEVFWQAGDIAEVGPRTAPQTPLQNPREYSIASLPADGCLQLLVRQQRHADGTLGLGSGWLTQRCPIGGEVALRVRSNPGFHLPPGPMPLVLIGNGTGLAGLRAWLKARVAAGHGRNWLVYGERHPAYDALLEDELRAWKATGMLAQLDLVYSRQGQGYVQDRLRERADALRSWVDNGATIAICGSLHGMAQGVDDALSDILGVPLLLALRADGRLRRDVY